MTSSINEKIPTSGTKNKKFHHDNDNAKPHVAERVKSYLKRNGFTIIRQPPYYPDSALSDFWLFDKEIIRHSKKILKKST